jgi:hypothetical protein
LYQSFFVLLFSGLLYILNDPIYSVLFTISIISAFIATIMGITGIYLNLFKKEPEEF